MIVSVVIRTYNEERYLECLLHEIRSQETAESVKTEIVIVDSGSTDRTLEISRQYADKVRHIEKSDFTFGRSLNIGCAASSGELLLLISGHCIPIDKNWVQSYIDAFELLDLDYAGGRQIGHRATTFSERKVFAKYYTGHAQTTRQRIPFVNNANACLRSELWRRYEFDEILTGLEDLDLAKRLSSDGYRIGYVSNASVYHIHNENWSQVRNRYERESIAMTMIWPQLTFNLWDLIFHSTVAVGRDMASAIKRRVLWQNLIPIIKYRWMQYSGTWRGYRFHSTITRRMKYRYYYSR